jgi:hypothetical protein
MDIASIDELAQAALASAEFTRVLQLAEFIGSGLELDEDGELKTDAVTEACKLVGIDLPVSEPADVDLGLLELLRLWDMVLFTGLVERSEGRAYATPKLADLHKDPDLAVQVWLQAAGAPIGPPEQRCPQCVTVLFELDRTGGAVSSATVISLVAEVYGGPSACPDCGEVHEGGAWEDEARHARDMIDDLLVYGAAAGDLTGEVRLTPLGRLLAETVFAPHRPAPDADAAAVVVALTPLPPLVAASMLDPWLTERTAPDAVRELLDYAVQATAGQRVIATAIAGFPAQVVISPILRRAAPYTLNAGGFCVVCR